MDLTENQKKDKETLYLHTPDPGFNPEEARETIARTIRKTDARRLKKSKDAIEALDERSNAVADYLKSLSNGSNKSIESYFGKKELARLQGQKHDRL